MWSCSMQLCLWQIAVSVHLHFCSHTSKICSSHVVIISLLILFYKYYIALFLYDSLFSY